MGLRQLRPLAAGERCVRVGLVQTGAMLVGDDDVRVEVEVGAGAALVLQDISATLAHPGADARHRLGVTVGAGGAFVLAEEPVVVAAGARLRRTVHVALAADARAVLRETLVLGRHGEAGGVLRARTRVERGGVPLLDDGLDTSDPLALSSPATLGGARVIASLAVFGGAAPAGPEAFALAGGGTLARVLAGRVHDVRDLDALLAARSVEALG